MSGLDFVHMESANDVVWHAPGFIFQGLAEKGKSYVFYFEGEGKVNISLNIKPEASYKVEWWDPESGDMISSVMAKPTNGILAIYGPIIKEDVALKISVE